MVTKIDESKIVEGEFRMLAMGLHPYCEIFPPMSNEELESLVEDIKKKGLVDDIVVFQGKILDGRNRFAACQKAGVEPRFTECPYPDPLDYVESKNLNRRNLSASQRGFAVAKLTGMRRGVNQFTKEDPLQKESSAITSDEAAKRGRVSHDTVTKSRAVLDKGVPELHKEVEKGAVNVTAAASVATLPPEEQKAIAAQGPEAIKAKAKEIKAAAKAEPAEPEAEYSPGDAGEEGKEPLMSTGPHPIRIEPLSNEAKERASQAAKDSGKLWLLKKAWRNTTKKDRSDFIKWLKLNGDILPRYDAGATLIATEKAIGINSYRPMTGMTILQQTRATFDRVSKDDKEYRQAVEGLAAYAEEKLSKLK